MTRLAGEGRRLTVGSLFSGVGGFDLGFARAGYDSRWFCEIDVACRRVLARHWPDAPLYEDVCALDGATLEPVDVIVGGFPCQDVSVAGQRQGLAGERSGLFFEFTRVVREMREATGGRYPALVVIENVPGLLNSHAGRDFAVVLGELAQLGPLDIGWAVLDAQWFGVPQRRRRVFVVVDFRGERAGQILALSEGLRGDPAPCRAAGEDIAGPLSQGASSGGGFRQDLDGTTYVASITGERTHALTSEGADASEDGTGRGTPLVAFHLTQDPISGDVSPALSQQITSAANYSNPQSGDPCHPLAAGAHAPAVAFTDRTRGGVKSPEWSEELAYALMNPGEGGRSDASRVLTPQATVRRLTPTECLRLMSWPDDWLDGLDLNDSTKYRMAGNGVVANVAEWIARRIVEAAS